jgi:hypothetical protein
MERMMPRRLLSLSLLGIWLLGGCFPGRTPDSSVGSLSATSSISSSTPPAGPSRPALPVQYPSLILRPGPSIGEWQVLGTIVNQSDLTLRSLELKVSLYDAGNHLLAQLNTLALQSPLAPGQQSPYQVDFASVPPPDHAGVDLAGFEQANPMPPQISTEGLHVLATADGDGLALGWLLNGGKTPVMIDALQALIRDGSGLPTTLQPSLAGPGYLESGARLPFAVRLPALAPSDRFEIYFTAHPTDAHSLPSVALPHPPLLEADLQGNLMVVGLLKNTDRSAHVAQALLSLMLGDELVGVARLAPPLPLGPEEELGFAINDFPALSGRLADEPNALKRLELHIDVLPAAPQEKPAELVPLQAELLGFEAVAGNLFLQGTLQRTTSGRLVNPAVMVTMRDEEGAVVSGGWSVVAADMPDANSLAFKLVLPLPAGTNPSMCEYDLRAAARQP